MLIKTLAELHLCASKMAELELQGLAASEDYTNLLEARIDLDPKIVEKETGGLWRWITLSYDSLKKELCNQLIDNLICTGHMCRLPLTNTDAQYNRIRVSTDLSNQELSDRFGCCALGLFLVMEQSKSFVGNNWWMKE